MLVDLHVHSTFSDGIYTPEQLVDKAIAAKLSVLALTDHDNVDGYWRAKTYIAAKQLLLQLISGVELDTDYRGNTVHVLGYYFDPHNAALLKALRWTRGGRVRRMEKMLAKLNALHYAITFDQVQEAAKTSTSIGRPHVARALIKEGYFATTAEVFDKLIAEGKPAYCKQEKLTPQEAVELLHTAGGIAVLAHPSEIKTQELVMPLLKEVAFDGLEVWHPSAREGNRIKNWHDIAKNRGLLMTGGSDLHGNKDRFPSELGIFKVTAKDVADVLRYNK